MLQHALRIGVRRYPCPQRRVFRALNTSTPTGSFGDTSLHDGQDVTGIHDDGSAGLLKGREAGFAIDKEILPVSVQTRSTTTFPSRANRSRTLRKEEKDSNPDGGGKPSRPHRFSRARSNIPVLFSTVVDVDSLEPYEMAASSREDATCSRISDEELCGILKTALVRPFKRLNDRLLHPATPQELELRLHQAVAFTPLPSLSRLINYHESYPSLHSAASYNFLVQLAIRHTSYSKAFELLRRMEGMGIQPDKYSKLLYVRLLVRIGRWDRAWTYVRQELATVDEKVGLSLLLELLGYCKPVEFGHKPLPDKSSNLKAVQVASEIPFDGAYEASVRAWQKNILAVIPNYLPSNAPPPVHFIVTVVRHLLRIPHMETARAVTMEWISHLPKHLSLPHKRHCLSLLHLHLTFSRKTFTTYLSNRGFVKLFLQQRPDIWPNSTTLFLLLRSLTCTHTRSKPTFHALQLVHEFRKKWGSGMIDRRVRRRIASIATREGRLHTARTWLEAENRASVSRELAAVEREVVGEEAVKPPQKIRRMPSQKLMRGVHAENRKWRWLKRRIWKLEQARLSKQPESQPVVRDSESRVVDQSISDV